MENDSEQKTAEDSQEKDYLPDFQLDEELGDGEDMEEDILLEEEEGDNDAIDEGDDEEGDDEDLVEEEEKMDDGEVKDVEEGMEAIKLQGDNGEDIVQIPTDDDKEKEDEVSHFLVADTKKMNLDNECLLSFWRTSKRIFVCETIYNRKVSAVYNMWL